MEIITIILVISHFIQFISINLLYAKNDKLRAEFFKKLSDSETQRDNLFIDFQKVVIENFNIADRNSKGQDENWEKIGEIFQEFDSIINEIDKKVNTALDDQEKYSIKRDRYENRLTEVCKAFDSLKLIMNKNTKLTADNFGCVNKVLGSIEINFNNIKDLPKKVDEIDRTLNEFLQKQLQAKNLKEILENPIEVTRPSCETKFKMKEEVKGNEHTIINGVVNKVDFNHGLSYFKIGDVFRKKEDIVFIYRGEEIVKILNLDNTYGKNIYNKFLQANKN